MQNHRRIHVGVQQEIVRGVGDSLQLAQCQKGYFKLPIVPKKLYTGSRGGLFYINQKGKAVYLNTPQKQRMAQNKLPGIVNPPGNFVPGQIPTSVFHRIDEQLQLAQQI